MDQEQNILQIKNLSKYFGGLAAVSDCSLKIKKGSITGIIGPNGSGKTTLFNLIAGNLKSSQGKVLFNNEDVTDVPSYELFSKGILRTFQIAHEFTNASSDSDKNKVVMYFWALFLLTPLFTNQSIITLNNS